MKCIRQFFCAIIIAMLSATLSKAETITINWLKMDKTLNQTTTCTVGGNVSLPSNIESKYGYTFKGFVDNYTPVEYIESTGSQHIDTGYKINSKTRIKTKIYITKLEGGFFGNATWGSYNLFYNNNKLYFSCYSDSAVEIANLKEMDTMIVDVNRCNLYVNLDGVEYNRAIGPGDFTSRYTTTIFSVKNNSYNSNGAKSIIKLYYFQMYDDDVLVRDFMPVVDSKGVACLYDKVEHKFYYNAGSGNFIAGPAI